MLEAFVKCWSNVCESFSISCTFAVLQTPIDEASSNDDDNLIEEVTLINLDQNRTSGIDVFKGGADIQRGRYISDHMGFLTDKQLCEAYFPTSQKAFKSTPDPDMRREAQDKLLESFPSTSAWNFVDRLKT